MDQDSFRRHAIFGAAVAALVGAAALTASETPSGSRFSPDIRVDVDMDEDDDNRRRRGSFITETRDLPSFERLQVRGAIELELTMGGEQTVRVRAREKDLAVIDTEVEDGTLIIGNLEEKGGNDWDVNGAEMTISVPRLTGLEILGAMDGDLRGLDVDAFELVLKGAGNVELSGSCGALEVDIRGAGNVEADDFRCKSVEVHVRGAGNADVYASESVEAKLSGIGAITVHGNPRNVDKSVGGLGEITVR